MIKIKSAEFVKGVVGDDRILRDGIPQIAFVGRSNTGKSSLINALVNKRDLVKTGRKPGKTTEINFFIINNKFYFVDLPGYGYAKVGMEQREKIRQLILWYLTKSESKPQMVALIIDVKIGLTELDREMIDILREQKQRFAIVANKIDKLSQKEVLNSLERIKKESGGENIFPYSAKTKEKTALLLEKLI